MCDILSKRDVSLYFYVYFHPFSMVIISYLHCEKIVVPGRNTGRNGRAPPLLPPAHIHWASGWPRSAGSSRRRDRRALAGTGWAHRW